MAFVFHVLQFKYYDVLILFVLQSKYFISRKLTACSNTKVNTSLFWTPDHLLANMTLKDCSCGIGTLECPAQAEGLPPPTVKVTKAFSADTHLTRLYVLNKSIST